MLGCPEADSPFLCQAMKRVAILGRRSSFHEEAALAFYQDIPLELKGFDSFKKMLAAYDSDEVMTRTKSMPWSSRSRIRFPAGWSKIWS